MKAGFQFRIEKIKNRWADLFEELLNTTTPKPSIPRNYLNQASY